MQKITIGSILFLSLLPGCAHLDFGQQEGEGLAYYEPTPYLFVTTSPDCKCTATVVVVPGTRKTVKFIPGYGSANLSVTLNNGMIATAGQITDAQVPATITAVSGLTTAAAGMLKSAREAAPTLAAGECTPTASLYPIVSGVVENKPISFPVK